MSKFILFILSASLILIPIKAYSKWQKGIGEWVYGPETSEFSACIKAKENAIKNASVKIYGETITSSKSANCKGDDEDISCKIDSFFASSFISTIKGEKDISRKIIKEQGHNKCVIVGFFDLPDEIKKANFEVGISINKTTFYDGDELKISLNPTHEIYVYIFQYVPLEGKVNLIFPNAFDTANRLSKKSYIPSDKRFNDYALVIKSHNKQTEKMSDEYLIFIATSSKQSFSSEYSINSLGARIAELPANSTKIIRKKYTIINSK